MLRVRYEIKGSAQDTNLNPIVQTYKATQYIDGHKLAINSYTISNRILQQLQQGYFLTNTRVLQ